MRENIIRQMAGNGIRSPETWDDLISYLTFNEEVIELANGKVYNLRTALIDALNLFPPEYSYLRSLARLITSDEFVEINEHMVTRKELLAISLDLLNVMPEEEIQDMGNDTYKMLGLSMRPDDIVVLNNPERYLTRNALFREGVVKMGENGYPLFAHLAVSMEPGEMLEMQDGSFFSRFDLCLWLYENKPTNAYTTIALAIFTRHLQSSIAFLQYALSFPDKKKARGDPDYRDAIDTGFVKEPFDFDYDMLSIGGEDERRALILALRGNDLRAFAENALQRREEEQMRGKFDNDGEPNRKRLRRDSPVMFE